MSAGSSSNGERTRRLRQALENRRRDFFAAARFLGLLDLVRRADQVPDEFHKAGLAHPL